MVTALWLTGTLAYVFGIFALCAQLRIRRLEDQNYELRLYIERLEQEADGRPNPGAGQAACARRIEGRIPGNWN